VHLAQRLRADGISVEEFTFSSQSVGRLAVTLYRLLADRLLLLPADQDLVDELVNVRLRETAPGVYRIDHDEGRHDDRVISLALVAHRLAEQPAGRGRFSGLAMARTRIVPWTP
jgi:phage FluMu gp28-like protein